MKKILTLLLASLALTAVVGTSAPPAQAQVVPVGGYCCDGYGYRRCMLPQLAPVGSACYCNYQGWGWTCQ